MAKKLSEYEGLNVKDICSNFTDNDQNMCAHFVSHVLGFSFGYNCRTHTGKQDSPAACIRVQEVFGKCTDVGKWDDKPADPGQCLIFVTTSTNAVDLPGRIFGNIPKKHIGIFNGGKVFHYSNNKEMVLKMELEDFRNYMKKSYGDISVYYGSYPTGTGRVEE